jgi:hypothetical protein
MRQRLLNATLAGALAAVFCLLAATAYTEVEQDDAQANCASANHTIERQATRCEICVVAPCDTSAMTMSNCGREATCAINGKVVDQAPKSRRTESRPRAEIQMQP